MIHRRIKESRHDRGVRFFAAITLAAASCAFIAATGSSDSVTTPSQVFDKAYVEPAPTTTEVPEDTKPGSSVPPAPLKRNAELLDLSVKAKEIADELGKCSND